MRSVLTIEECASSPTATPPAAAGRRGPGLALGGLAGDYKRRQVGGRSAGDKAATGGGRQPGPLGDQPQHYVLGVDGAGGLQPGDPLDGRTRDQHVEQQRRLGGAAGIKPRKRGLSAEITAGAMTEV
jgi:hypothetical protein